jgi:hypothetical protein
MGAVEDWDVFARGLAPDPVAGSGCSGWSLVFARRGRALALPASALSQAAGLDFFVRTSSKWWWAQLLTRCRRVARGLLPEAHLSAEQYRELRRIVSGTCGEPGEEAGEVVGIQFGSSGPLQKVMVLGRARGGSWNVAKLALRPSADDQVLAEAAWLECLASCPGLAAHVPAVTGAGKTVRGRPYFVMRAVAGKPVPATFGADHLDLLRSLAGADCRVELWEESALVRTIESRLAGLAAPDRNGLQLLRAGWSSACRVLAGKRVPLCLSHGDFAAWNLLRADQGLIAVDWEYAQPRWNPLGDFFHFHLISSALDGGLRKGRIRRDRLLADASRHAVDVFDLDAGFAALLAPPLLLVYLVDTVSFYARASGGINRKDPVVDSYLQYMAEQA